MDPVPLGLPSSHVRVQGRHMQGVCSQEGHEFCAPPRSNPKLPLGVLETEEPRLQALLWAPHTLTRSEQVSGAALMHSVISVVRLQEATAGSRHSQPASFDYPAYGCQKGPEVFP